jgi:hypothetical protein
MEINKLSDNGYKISNVLDESLFNEISQLVDTFIPTAIRPTSDRPDLPSPGDTRREVLLLNKTHPKLKSKLDNYFFQNFSKIIPKLSNYTAIELWRDYPGYTNELHYDNEIVKHIIIVYLDGKGEENIGTIYYENDEKYLVSYEKNNEILLLNSNQVWHGMSGNVPNDIKYRKLLYINWVNRG